MKIKTILLLILVSVMSGCGVFRRTPAAANRATESPQEQYNKTVRLYPAHDVRHEMQPMEVQATSSEAVAMPRAELSFSTAESAHVRALGIHNVADGVIELNLDNLAREFCYPYRGKLISDYGMRNGRMHTGVDLKAVKNDTIRSAMPGVVRMSKLYSSYGNIVVIRHYDGIETVYSHASKNLVKPNDTVEAGTPIALAGRTGRATTEHLHFEVRYAGEPIDPKLLIDCADMTLNGGTLYIAKNGKSVAGASTREGAENAVNKELQNQAALQADRDAAKDTADSLRQSTPKEPAAEYYKVQKGDTLYSIARRHGTTVKKLCSLNSIKESTLLQIVKRLRVK
jgi:murein DD-endopeptidase MepM/ murein hydrolase activator NlpD